MSKNYSSSVQRREKRSTTSDYENINFNLSPLHKSNSVLVTSSLLTLRIGQHNLSQTRIHVAQKMSAGELIFLDTLDFTDEDKSDEEELILQLDVTHAVQAWLEDASSNLGFEAWVKYSSECIPMMFEK